MNRKLMSAILACGAATFATGAMAADLPSAAPAPAPYIAPPPVFTWTGFYVGGVAGATFNNTNHQTFTPGGLPGSPNLNPGNSGNNNAAFTGGIEAGYNYQVNQFVFGIEGDVDYKGNNNSSDGTFQSPAFYAQFPTYTIAGEKNQHWFGTIRGRLGWAAFDRALIYVTGGAAFGSNGLPTSVTFAGPTGVVCGNCTFNSTNNNNNNVGGIVGGGVEYAFTDNWTGKVEYLHTFFGKKNMVYANNIGQTFTTNGENFDTNIVRVGLNYKF